MSTKKIVLIILIVLIVLIGLSYWMGRQVSKFAFSPAPSTSLSDDSWLNLNPSAYVPEYNEMMPLNILSNKDANSMQNMSMKIRRAKDDRRISGLIIQPFGASLSLATLHELGLAIQDFKTSGKPVIAFGDMMTQGDYLLATYADEIYMEPSASAGLILTGSSANTLFYKELFDKIGIKMHIIQAGEFKGAGEPYSQTSYSEGTRSNIEEMLLDRFNLIISEIAERRDLTVDDVKAVYNNRRDFILSAAQAQELRLIDYAKSQKQMYAEHSINPEHIVGISSYAPRQISLHGDKVAVLFLEGNIATMSGGFNQSIISQDKVKLALKDIKEDPSIKAVVLRINSPGGSALESELIYQELLDLKSEKPILVSMGGVAASGGYYISCAADHIMADPGTITGSIGVIMMLPETTELGHKLGLRSQTIGFGKFSGAITPFEPYSSDLLASLKRNSIGTYDEFKSRVMTARQISPDRINSIAEGRIYSAEDAMAVNLVDDLGYLDDAIALAAEMAGISEYQVQYLPRKISFFEAIKDMDFLSMQMKNLLGDRWWDFEAKIAEKLETIPLNEWLYLMPYMVE
nr:protease [Candidatus Cloacimonadota bacterium]